MIAGRPTLSALRAFVSLASLLGEVTPYLTSAEQDSLDRAAEGGLMSAIQWCKSRGFRFEGSR